MILGLHHRLALQGEQLGDASPWAARILASSRATASSYGRTPEPASARRPRVGENASAAVRRSGRVSPCGRSA